MVVAAGLAAAQVAAARGDYVGVLRALEPVVGIRPREGADEPGFWPWQVLSDSPGEHDGIVLRRVG